MSQRHPTYHHPTYKRYHHVLPVLLLVVLLAHLGSVSGFSMELRPKEKQCLYEMLKEGDQLMVGFQVMDGTGHQVDFWITRPNGEMEVSKVKSTGYEHTVHAKTTGRHSYCFENKGSRYPPKLLSFYTYLDPKSTGSAGSAGSGGTTTTTTGALVDPLERELQHLKDGLRSITEEQQYLVHRERAHRDTAESTNSRVMVWGLVQAAVLVGVCLFQVYYLQHFFNTNHSTKRGI